MNVGVVGAGAVGLAVADALAGRGAAVTVHERDSPGSGASGRAAGIVYDAFADRTNVELARRSMARYRDLDAGFRRTPYVWFTTDDGESRAARGGGGSAAAIESQVADLRDRGVDAEAVDPAALRARFPQLDVADVTAAAIATGAGVVDPPSAVRALATNCRERDVRIQTDRAVEIRTDPARVVGAEDGESATYDAVVVAAGPNTRALLASVGVDLALRPYRAQILEAGGPAIPTLYDATTGHYARPTRRGLLAGDGVTGIENPDEVRASADESFVAATRDWLDDRLVNLESRVHDSWAGICTTTPDGDPLLGRATGDVYVAAGWHGSGLMRAPGAGEALAASLLDGDDSLTFDPGRFHGDEPISLPRPR